MGVAVGLGATVILFVVNYSQILAAAFHEFAAYQLAERLADTTRLVSTLSK